ncbi:MAG: hypothetical protein HYT15_04015 [Candidatus Magasanikbacteria bacterium]|nr:hypothetical protein [Candidatus Magasanikbacteria bacterium]
MKSKAFWVVIFLVLFGTNVLFASLYLQAKKELEGTKVILSSQQYRSKYMDFLKMFIKLVIKSDKEVDFETRLKLENAVRGLKEEYNDPEILAQWQKFVNSGNEAEAQANVKELLGMLVDKVYALK